ncbi:MAG TPA: ATP-binding cassette domain-containing protein [Candidatus Kapabacteria bacterium]|nr:ATP-binding cassette domain-containing protein [Candidatus Kapabacteria bacterium]
MNRNRSVAPDSSPWAVDAEGLQKRFRETHAVDGVSLRVERGSVFGLLGPNGAGKTTVVRMLTTLLSPDAGRAVVAGFDVVKEPREVRRRIGLVGQYASVDELLTGRQNLRMLGRLYGLSSKDARARAEELLEHFDLVDAASKIAKTYSGGMRRRLDLAASLVLAPPVLFLDEPTTGLDPRSRAATWEVIDTLTKDGTTVILTTQYLEEADQFADRIAVIDKGRMIAEGTPAQLKAKVAKATVIIRGSEHITPQAALALVGTLGTGVPTIAEDEVRIAVDDIEHAGAILSTLAAAGVSLDDVSFTQASLDDVFFQLTGRTEASGAQEGAPQ